MFLKLCEKQPRHNTWNINIENKIINLSQTRLGSHYREANKFENFCDGGIFFRIFFFFSGSRDFFWNFFVVFPLSVKDFFTCLS